MSLHPIGSTGKKVWIPKSRMSMVPPGFERTWMGEPKGALAQYRGPDNLHLLEYPNGWELHRDFGNPRSIGGLIVHIFLDAPEVGLSFLIATSRAQTAYEKSGSVWQAIGDFTKSLVGSYLTLRALRALIEWLAGTVRQDPEEIG